MTNEELRADLLADPDTAELAAEQDMTVEEYIAATLAYCDDPDRGFAGCRDAADCDGDGDGDDAVSARGVLTASAFESRLPPSLPCPAPGAGAEACGGLPAFAAKGVRRLVRG